MALNLWKIGGKPTSYNPLPLGFGNGVSNLSRKEYVVTLKAKSASGATLDITDNVDESYKPVLTNEFKVYTFSFTFTGSNFALVDMNNHGDIIITDIELVEKPLSKLTINGIDGFASGKWTLGANATVISDNKLEIISPGVNIDTDLIIPCIPNTRYSFTYEGEGGAWLERKTSSHVYINGTIFSKSLSFTTESNAVFIRIAFFGKDATAGKTIYSNVMLNLGSTPAPYEPKTGERMVVPQVKGRNLFNKATVTPNNYVNSATGALSASGAGNSASDYMGVIPSQSYAISGIPRTIQVSVTAQYAWYNASKVYISGGASTNNAVITAPANAYYLRLTVHQDDWNTAQFEKGTQSTYEPYAVQLNPKPKRNLQAKTGLSFNGVSDYLQLPSMTMDSIEIDCKLNLKMLGWETIFDTRMGSLPHVFEVFNGVPQSANFNYSGFKNNERTIIRLTSTNGSFSSNAKIFAQEGVIQHVKGTLYKVTYYLGGNVVAQYDFENPSTLVGDKVLPNAVNLIPSFEDSRWSLHSNFRVLGKDVGRLENVSVEYSTSYFYNIPVKRNTAYLIAGNVSKGGYIQPVLNVSGGQGGVTSITKFISFTTGNDTSLELRIFNDTGTTGTFDFIKPQLYELPSTVGTVVGRPAPQVQPPRRNLYAKR